MTKASSREQVTLSRETIHNPKDARHFMRIRPVAGRVRILRDGVELGASDNAVRVIEAGYDLYDPVIYLPAGDISANLAPADKDRTYCPIKGHASYFNLMSDDGSIDIREIAWSYDETLAGAEPLADRVAFYASHVVIEEHPEPAVSAA